MLIFLWICFVGQALFWGLYFGTFVFRSNWLINNQLPLPCPLPSVSVVICARNEGANLRKNLPTFLHQAYPSYEVLLVDDDSSDETPQVLSDLMADNPRLRCLHLEAKTKAGKKFALVSGIENARYDWILLSDADCMPASEHWIREMITTALQDKDTEIVLGFGPYRSYPGWLNEWIRYETCLTALQYFSAAYWGIPYMGVGRNLLYKRSLYQKHKAVFEQHSDLASGDDDLFINVAAQAGNTKFCISSKSFVFSEPKRSFLMLYQQKTRHYSSSVRYKYIHRLLLGAWAFSFLGFWVTAILLLFFYPWLILSLVLIRFLLIFVLWAKILPIFGNHKAINKIFALDILSFLFYLIFAPALFFKHRSSWK